MEYIHQYTVPRGSDDKFMSKRQKDKKRKKDKKDQKDKKGTGKGKGKEKEEEEEEPEEEKLKISEPFDAKLETYYPTNRLNEFFDNLPKSDPGESASGPTPTGFKCYSARMVGLFIDIADKAKGALDLTKKISGRKSSWRRRMKKLLTLRKNRVLTYVLENLA